MTTTFNAAATKTVRVNSKPNVAVIGAGMAVSRRPVPSLAKAVSAIWASAVYASVARIEDTKGRNADVGFWH